MLNFVARVYRTGMNVILWMTLIGCAIGGGILGYIFSGRTGGYAFLGVLGGIFIGLLINILGGGFVANILSMVDNIEKMANGDK